MYVSLHVPVAGGSVRRMVSKFRQLAVRGDPARPRSASERVCRSDTVGGYFLHCVIAIGVFVASGRRLIPIVPLHGAWPAGNLSRDWQLRSQFPTLSIVWLKNTTLRFGARAVRRWVGVEPIVYQECRKITAYVCLASISGMWFPTTDRLGNPSSDAVCNLCQV